MCAPSAMTHLAPIVSKVEKYPIFKSNEKTKTHNDPANMDCSEIRHCSITQLENKSL